MLKRILLFILWLVCNTVLIALKLLLLPIVIVMLGINLGITIASSFVAGILSLLSGLFTIYSVVCLFQYGWNLQYFLGLLFMIALVGVPAILIMFVPFAIESIIEFLASFFYVWVDTEMFMYYEPTERKTDYEVIETRSTEDRFNSEYNEFLEFKQFLRLKSYSTKSLNNSNVEYTKIVKEVEYVPVNDRYDELMSEREANKKRKALIAENYRKQNTQ